MGKRLFDLFFAAAGLVALLPIFLLMAVAIKLDSPGPVFFRQERVGRFGRPFRIFKFRTMHTRQPDSAPQITIGRDSRITRTGAVLRAAKIDELPQLLNVLTGDMSLVGPRPEVPRYVAQYGPKDRALVLSVRPGITDFASIYFRNESDLLAREADPERAYVTKIMPRKLRYYRFYVRRRSLCLDLGLIFKTVAALFR